MIFQLIIFLCQVPLLWWDWCWLRNLHTSKQRAFEGKFNRDISLRIIWKFWDTEIIMQLQSATLMSSVWKAN